MKTDKKKEEESLVFQDFPVGALFITGFSGLLIKINKDTAMGVTTGKEVKCPKNRICTPAKPADIRKAAKDYSTALLFGNAKIAK